MIFKKKANEERELYDRIPEISNIFCNENGYNPLDTSQINFHEAQISQKKAVNENILKMKYLAEKDPVLSEIVESETEKKEREFVRRINSDIDRTILNLSEDFKITRYALEKAQYVSQRIIELARNAGINCDPEVGMYTLSDKPVSEDEDNVITDVHIWNDQYVTSSNCFQSGIDSKLRKLKKRVNGWVHSHGAFNTFFSSTDEEAAKKSSRIFETSYDVKSLQENLSIDVFKNLVLNGNGDYPYFRITILKPHFFYSEGKIKQQRVSLKVERDKENQTFLNPILVEDGRILSVQEMQEIDETILNDIYLNYNQRKVKLKEFYFNNDGTLLIDLPKFKGLRMSYSELFSKERVSEKKPETVREEDYQKEKSSEDVKVDPIRESIKKQKRIKERVVEKSSLEKRVEELEKSRDKITKNYLDLRQDYKKLENDYLSLRQENQDIKSDYLSLTKRLDALERKPLDYEQPLSRSFTKNIENYYTPRLDSSIKEEQVIGTFAKLISGQYRANLQDIKQGDYTEKNSENLIWKWKDRLEAIETFYVENKDAFNNLSESSKNSLKQIIYGNKYLNEKYPEIVSRILNMVGR